VPHHTPTRNRQADLAERLASLLPRLPPATARLYFDCYLATMRREWFAIDYHRLDKFLMLVRRFVVAMLALLRDRKW
jgi:ribosomal RNA-processing protein 1